MGWGLEGGTDLRGQEEAPAIAAVSTDCECRGHPLSSPKLAVAGLPPPPLSSGDPQPQELVGLWEEAVGARLGVSSAPPLHCRSEWGGAGSWPPPGHEPVPAAPGTVAGTPGRLPRPPAHTHPQALALRALPASQASRGGPSPALRSPHPGPLFPIGPLASARLQQPTVLASPQRNLGSLGGGAPEAPGVAALL